MTPEEIKQYKKLIAEKKKELIYEKKEYLISKQSIETYKKLIKDLKQKNAFDGNEKYLTEVETNALEAQIELEEVEKHLLFIKLAIKALEKKIQNSENA